ncbi:MAG: hypothetical protein EHM70_18980, partial [Chloroflexota bacterium]
MDTPTSPPTALPTIAPAVEAPSSNQQPLQKIAMMDTNHGWAVGYVEGGMTAPILFTSDGGVSWLDRTPPGLATGMGNNSPAAFFQSVERAWLAYATPAGQPVVWNTQDSGQNWTASQAIDLSGIPMEFFFPSDLGFLDDQFGWIIGHLGAGMSHDYIAVLTTADGGSTWQRRSDPDSAPEIQACQKSGLIFTSPEDGWLAGDCPGLMPPLFLYQTKDGGLSWSRVSLPAGEGMPDELVGHLGDQCGVIQLATISPGDVFLTLRC